MSRPACFGCRVQPPQFLEEGTGRFFCGSSCQLIAGKRPREEESLENLLQAWAFLKNLPETNLARKALTQELDQVLRDSLSPERQDVFKKIIEAGYESPNVNSILMALEYENENLALWLIESGKSNVFDYHLYDALRKDSLPLIAAILKRGVDPNQNPTKTYERIESVEALQLLLDAGLTKESWTDSDARGEWNGLMEFIDRGREELALYLLSQGFNPLGTFGHVEGTALHTSAFRDMYTLVRELMKFPQLSPFQEDVNGRTALSVSSIPMQMVLLTEFYTREFLKNNLVPQHNVSNLLAARTLQEIICEELSSMPQNYQGNWKRQILELAKIMKVPQDIQDSWRALSGEDICQEVSDILAIGGVWDAEKIQQTRRERLSYYERFLRGLDFLNIRWRDRSFQEVLEELRRKTR